MFSRYSSNNNSSYNNLGEAPKVGMANSSFGRRALGEITNNAKNSVNIDVNAGNGKTRMHAGNDKQLMYQHAPKIPQSYININKDNEDHQRKKTHWNPLLPAINVVANNSQQFATSITRTIIASSSYQYTGRVDDIDARSADDPQFATDYVEDMYNLFRTTERMTTVLPIYMESTQSHINEKMRAILVDWLVEVHMKFKLVPESLFLTVNLIDRYLERQEVTRSNLQLLGVSCMLIATKYEEIYPPSVNELVYICDNAYTRTNIIDMETQILRTLNYQITQPSAHTFLIRYLKAAHADKEMSQIACFLLDSTLQSYSMLSYLPSQLAAAAVLLARHNCRRNLWSPTLLKYAIYEEQDIVPVARALWDEKLAASPDLHSINKKYSTNRYGNVASKPLNCDF